MLTKWPFYKTNPILHRILSRRLPASATSGSRTACPRRDAVRLFSKEEQGYNDSFGSVEEQPFHFRISAGIAAAEPFLRSGVITSSRRPSSTAVNLSRTTPCASTR